MTEQKRGVGLVGGIVILVICLVVVGAVFYIKSDVFSTKVNTQIDEFTKWTPANIAQDPENYLNFCEAQTNKAMQDLKTNEISIAQSRAKLESMQGDCAQKIGVGENALSELKDVYQKAEAGKSWPATWQGQPREKDWTKRQIVALAKQTDSQKNLRTKVEAGIKKLDAQVIKVQDAKAKAQEQLAEIKTSREMLKVQKLTDDLTNKLVSMKSVLQATVASATETTGVISLDQLTKDSASTIDDKEFDKIMGQGATSKPS